MPPSLFYAYWSWCILFGGWVDWTWWILKNSLIHFKSRLCKQINGVAEEKVKNVAILSVRLQLEDGLCKINTTVRVAGIQELKTIYFPAKAFLYWANCRSNAASTNPGRISFHYFSPFFLFLLLHLHSKWIGLKWIYRSVFDVAQNVSEPWKLFVTVRVAFDVTNRGLEWNDDKIAHPTLILFISDICLFRDLLQNILQPCFKILSGKNEKKKALKSRNWPHQERKSSRQWQ